MRIRCSLFVMAVLGGCGASTDTAADAGPDGIAATQPDAGSAAVSGIDGAPATLEAGPADASADASSSCDATIPGVPLVPDSVKRVTVCASGCDYATIQSALDVAAPGWTIAIGNGTYRERPSLHTSGTEAHPISIVAAPGAHPVIAPGDATAMISAGDEFDLQADWVLLDGLDIQHSNFGVHAQGASHLTIRRSRLHHNCGVGLEVAATTPGTPVVDVLVEDDVFDLNSTPSNGLAASCGSLMASPFQGHGVYLSDFSCAGLKRMTLRRSTFAQNGGGGIQLNSVVGSSACPPPGGFYDVLVENDLFDGNAAGMYLFFGVHGLTVRNDTFVADAARLPVTDERNPTFLALWGEVSGSTFVNNVFYGPAAGASYWPLYVVSQGTDLSGTSFDHDVWDVAPNAPLYWKASSHSFADYTTLTGWDTQGTCCGKDPMFVTATNHHLAPGSPAAKTGDDAHCPADDADGRCRVSPCDVGMFAR